WTLYLSSTAVSHWWTRHVFPSVCLYAVQEHELLVGHLHGLIIHQDEKERSRAEQYRQTPNIWLISDLISERSTERERGTAHSTILIHGLSVVSGGAPPTPLFLSEVYDVHAGGPRGARNEHSVVPSEPFWRHGPVAVARPFVLVIVKGRPGSL
ncbi:hypothetical protein J6590_019895, partial [Homalodisca vitripennis]